MNLLTRTLVVSVCLVTAAMGISAASRTEKVPLRTPLSELPFAFDGWKSSPEEPMDEKSLAVLKPDDYTIRTYSRGPSDYASLFIAYFGSQRQGETLHSPLNCLPGAGWIPTSLGRSNIIVTGNDGRPRAIDVNRVVIEKGLDRSLVLYWYQSHGRVTASEYWGKFYTVVDSIRLARSDAALVRVTIPMGPDDHGAADNAAVSFVRALFPQLPRHLPA
jgi:EpsI family protein